MPEMATPENEDLISRVYGEALDARNEGRALSVPDQVVYEIEMLSQEVNSGASFEQYFRWASRDEIAGVVGRLEQLGLAAVAELARRAIEVAFPDGLPGSDEEKAEQVEWSPDQETQLAAPADAFSDWNGRIINVLAAFHRDSGAR